jgi:RluA family pseudouridine synthase
VESKIFIVGANESGQRIDIFLASKLPDLSRRKVRAILDIGGCYVNGKRMHIASRQVHHGDKVKVEYTLTALGASRQKVFVLQPEDVLFDSEDVIAMNKPPGLQSQATRDQDISHAEVALKDFLKSQGKSCKQLILCHRLDKETSGILLFAKNAPAATNITNQFKERKVKKMYLALVYGRHQSESFEVKCYLSEIDKRLGRVFVVPKGGKSSDTQFELIKHNQKENVSLLGCYPRTGRSHQIRVHLESVKLPILGDKKYGLEHRHPLPENIMTHTMNHHLLHAFQLSFHDPKEPAKQIEIHASIPAGFQELMTKLDMAIPTS